LGLLHVVRAIDSTDLLKLDLFPIEKTDRPVHEASRPAPARGPASKINAQELAAPQDRSDAKPAQSIIHGLFSDSASDTEWLWSTRAQASNSIPSTRANRSPAIASAGLASMTTPAVTSVSAADLCIWDMAAEFMISAMSSYCVGSPTARLRQVGQAVEFGVSFSCRAKVTC
jgi:hypothetical protein